MNSYIEVSIHMASHVHSRYLVGYTHMADLNRTAELCQSARMCSRLQLDVRNLSLGCAIWWMLTR